MIALKVEDSRTEDSRDVLFVAVAVYSWTGRRNAACLLTESACSFSYMPTRLKRLHAGEERIFPDDVSDTCSELRLIVHLLARIYRKKLRI